MGLFDRLRGGVGDRVAFFGIDGVPFSLVENHPETFPNLHEMMDAGDGDAIDSIVPPESSACWPSLTTGVNPGETGVYGFQDREVGSYETYVPMGRDVQATRVWDRVESADRRATVLNVPVTFPPQRNVQRMVSGFLSPSVEKAAYPDELRDYLQSIDYRIDVDAKLGHDPDKSAFIEDAHATLDARYEAFDHYVEADDWDLLFGVFMTTDRVNHFLFEDYERDGEYREEFLEFYAAVDRYLGDLRASLADDVTMVVASDHGFTTLDHEVHLNAWLRERGWLDFEDRYTFDVNAWLAATGRLAYADGDPAGPADLAADTDVYAVADDDAVGRFKVHLDGRDSEGTVSEDDYEAVVDDLAAALREVTGPNGEPVAERVVVAGRNDGPGVESPDLQIPRGEEADVVVHPTRWFDVDTSFGGAAETPADAFSAAGPSTLDHVSANTRAYSFIPGRFYLNLEGREPRGTVPEDRYREVRADLKADLEALTGPDGRSVVDRVVETEQAFEGDHDDIAPDLVAIPNDGFDLKSGFSDGGEVFTTGPRNGMHTFRNATLVVDDPSVRVDGDVNLFDVAPTLLNLLDVDFQAADFDGRSLVKG